MTDKELLELAARACGWQVIWYGTKSEIAPINTHGGASGTRWNPLTDDGDALRLVIDLGLHIEMYCHHVKVIIFSKAIDPIDMQFEYIDNGKAIVTRRAIVRAAAEIGRRMK